MSNFRKLNVPTCQGQIVSITNNSGTALSHYYIVELEKFDLVKVLSIYELKKSIVEGVDPEYEYFHLQELYLVATDLNTYADKFF